MMDLFAPRHLLVILVIALVVFGGKKLKTFGSDLGSAVRGFKQAMKEGESEEHAATAAPATVPGASPPELTAPPAAASAAATTSTTGGAKAA